MTVRTLRYVPLEDLRGNPANPKAHDGALIGASIDRFGYVEPQVLDGRTGMLVAGHGRLERLQAMRDAGDPAPDGVRVAKGQWLVPVVVGWSSADDTEASAYLVASNQSTIAGGWDLPRLSSVLGEVRSTDLGLDGTGYTSESLDDIIASLQPVASGSAFDEDDDAERPIAEKRVEAGTIWALGPHRIMCGDARNPEHVDMLLSGVVVNVAFTSPPYADRRKYDESTEFRPVAPEAYVEWFAPVAANVAAHLAEDGSWFVNIKAGAEGLDTYLYVVDLVVAHARLWGWHMATEFCWERPGMPQEVARRFKNQFESVYQFTMGEWKIRPNHVRRESSAAIANVGPGGGNTAWSDSQGSVGHEWFNQRHRDGFAFPGNRLPTFAGTHEATGHGAAFPVGLPAWFIRAYSDEGDTVFDPFVGSGSTLLAAEQEHRVGYGMELSPGYCDVILDRWERHGGSEPVRLDTTP